ncbi:hypothetical protein [Acidovorax sp. SUPP3334]|uniref:hypothetical protein n=1 Tax=Acidovorax sp. SUPP3334 TaxID=2920881 RepID=UPI0023DE4BF2|nr:hypothetical protein [Acidovorax sp. SUPP3334]GKT22709.1 hypothetical protein AVHM3334_09295 [Acidovorax sp. SUPP3334]
MSPGQPAPRADGNVKTAPHALSEIAGGSGLWRMPLDKRFHGKLNATGTGEMLAFRSATQARPATSRWKPCTAA